MRYQVLVSANELGSTARSFSGLGVFCTSSDDGRFSATYNAARIYFCHTTNTVLSATFDDNYSGNTPVPVLNRDLLVLNWTQNIWNEIRLDSWFSYNGTDNLLIEIRWASAQGSLYTATEYPVVNLALLGLASATNGYLQSSRHVFQLWYSPVAGPHIDLVTMAESTNVVLRWNSFSGELYSVSSSTNLLSGAWSNLNTSPFVGGYSGQNQCTVDVDVADQAKFFRVTSP